MNSQRVANQSEMERKVRNGRTLPIIAAVAVKLTVVDEDHEGELLDGRHLPAEDPGAGGAVVVAHGGAADLGVELGLWHVVDDGVRGEGDAGVGAADAAAETLALGGVAGAELKEELLILGRIFF